MPSKNEFGLTEKQEAFAQAFIENGGNASEAYRSSYSTSNMADKTINEVASKLLKDYKVATRVEGLRKQLAEAKKINLERLAEMLIQDRALAHKTEDSKAAGEITMNLARLVGEYVDKRNVQSDNKHHHVTEAVSDTTAWLDDMLRVSEDRETSESGPH